MTESQPPAREEDRNWSRLIVVAGVAIVCVVLLGLLGAAVLPRWWAQRVGDQVQGSITGGVLLGLFYGFVFTVLPLTILVFAWRKLHSWRLRAAALALALILATPNLLTLGIVIGEGNAAHAGDRILDVEAPGFRGGSLGGALAAVGALVFLGYLLFSRRRAWQRVQRLEESARTTDAGPPDTPEP